MSYPLLEQAPKDHHSEEFLEFLRLHNPVLHETESWLIIENCKYGYPTAFSKTDTPNMQELIDLYGEFEWKVKPKANRTVERFHVHILTPQ